VVSSNRVTKVAKNKGILDRLKWLKLLGHALEEGRIMDVS
jgi:hypothetical protein